MATITLNRPEKRNAISRQVLEELAAALEDLHLEKRVRGIVLTGAGDVFCAGMDLNEMQETSESPDAETIWGQDAEAYRDLLLQMLRFPKPLIAAVQGPALAGGVGLTLACDMVLASERARFALPEPRRGIVAGIVTPLLAFRIGAGRAAPMLLTAQTIDAAEALRIGLVHKVALETELADMARESVEQIALSSPSALTLTKRVLNEMVGENLETLLSAGAAASATARTTDAAREGLAAFLAKREPNWDQF